MTTAAKLTNSACTYIGVKRLGVDLTAPEYDEAVDLIRDMLIEMQTRNIKFRVDIPSSSTDEINEPDWASSYLKTELAIRLCPLYTVSVSSELMRSHREAKRAVYSFLVDLTDIQKNLTFYLLDRAIKKADSAISVSFIHLIIKMLLLPAQAH